MVEIRKKYKIYEKKFGYVNWLGAYSLWLKETKRFMNVWAQTLAAPCVTTYLFYLILSIILGTKMREDILGFPFITFLIPGLISMSLIQQSFSHSSSSILISKVQGTINDILHSPLNAAEITLAITLAACTRSFVIAIVLILFFYFIVELNFYSFFYIFIFTFLSSFFMGALGIIIGLWSEKYDSLASATNFIIQPLAFLSGSFYSINRLPDLLRNISEFNPFYSMISGFRYGFLGASEGSVQFSLYYLIALSCITWFIAFFLFRKGWKIKF